MSTTWDLLLDAFHINNHRLLLSAAITNLWGYVGYGIALYNVVTRKRDIFPFWMHAFYLAHDSSLSIRALIAAPTHEWHWFLVTMGVALGLWTVQEIYVIFDAVSNESHIPQPKLELGESQAPMNLTEGPVFEAIPCCCSS